jgi:glycosyltransferase involved in cell wall biosynthesis
MRCPSLADLPPSPPGRTGWPWIVDSAPMLNQSLDTNPWPRVSIVTPSYNQAPFLEETIRSVLLQAYPDLEYHIVDGGSTDASVDIIRAYEPWLASWTSRRDDGQSDAINRGFSRATGEIFGWLNSDDLYEPGSIQRVTAHFASAPACALVYGSGWYIDASSRRTHRCEWIRPFDRKTLLTFNFILQPAAFWRRWLWDAAGNLDVAYYWAMDWDWFIRATLLSRPHYVPVDLARCRAWPRTKTSSGGRPRQTEIAAICRRYGGIFQPTHMVYQLDRFTSTLTHRLGPGHLGSAVRRALGLTGWFLRRMLWRGRCLL